MQNNNGLFGGFALILTLGLAGCGGADHTPGGGAGSPRPAGLVGRWRADAGAHDYAEDFDLRADGTATLTRRLEARSWVATYACEWSAAGPARATQGDPWILERACQLVSSSGAASTSDAGIDLDFVDVLSIVTVATSGFVAEPPDQSQLKFYARRDAAE